MVGDEAPSSPRSGGRKWNHKEADNPNHRLGHKRGHEDCGLGRLPGGDVSRTWLGRSKRPDPTCVPACRLPLGLSSGTFLFFVMYKWDLPHSCLKPSMALLLSGERWSRSCCWKSLYLGLTGHTVPRLSLSHALPSHHHPEVLLVTQEPS